MADVSRTASYTAADGIPIKLFLNEGISELRPVHIQWMPTNHCNLHCKFCSCSERERGLQMDLPTARRVIDEFAALGCLAVTITGGGEPLCHPDLAEMIQHFDAAGIGIGLVTNGLMLDLLDRDALGKLTWCRISNSDEREMSARYRGTLERAVAGAPKVDWAFSHVVSHQPNFEEISRIVDFAIGHNFTHVRIVADLLCADEINLGPVRKLLAGKDQLVIYQERKAPEPCNRCMIGYIKPVVTPDFRLFLCCGAQYALEPMTLDFPDALCMGSALELSAVYGKEGTPFHVPCVRCWYRAYNTILEALTGNIKHKEFI